MGIMKGENYIMEERAIVEASNNTGNSGVNLFAFTNIDRAWKFASLLSESAIIPDTFRKNPVVAQNDFLS